MRRYIVLVVLAVAQFTISFPLEASAKKRLSDAAAPSLTTLSVPSTAISLTVSGIGIAATDNVGVTGYFLSESPATPAASATGWRIVAPTSYVFSSAGSKTLYAWAKDAAGNVSASKSAAVMITLPDTIAPIVAISAPTNNAVVSGTVTIAAAASDNVGVTKVEFYSNGDLSHTAMSAPYSYVVDTRTVLDGSYILVAKAYDRAGNIGSSSPISAKVANNLDVTVPVVNAFTLPSVATSLTIAVSAFTASDNVGVTGYRITESAVPPLAAAAGWSAVAPTSFVFSGSGTRTAYAWVKDAAGNVSAGKSALVTVTLPDTTAPTVAITSPANNSTVNGIVTISATASDNVRVSQVEFYINGVLDTTVTSAPYSVTADTRTVADGTYTIVAKARDSAGNLGTSSNVSVQVNNSNSSDVTKPIVNTFTMPATSTSLIVSVSAFTVSDNAAVTGYRITETSTAPAAGAAGWSASAPSAFVFAAAGVRTAYAWAKDAAGNVSAAKTASVTITLATQSNIIFEDNFDSQADWQPRPALNDVSPSGGMTECNFNETCVGIKAPPTGWTHMRSTGWWWGPTYQDTIRIKATAGDGTATDRQGKLGGKAFIVYNESNEGASGDGWGADGQITKLFPQDYREIYMQAWLRTQANWNPGVYSMIKMIRAFHFDRTGNIYLNFSNGFSAPTFLWDFKFSDVWGTRYMASLFCKPQSTIYYCPNNGGVSPDNLIIANNNTAPPSAPGMPADEKWHSLTFHLKMNTYNSATSTWNADGIYEFSYDGTMRDSFHNIQWNYAGADPTVGWNAVALGGNAFNQYEVNATHAEQWYAIDDVVVSTTPIPDNYVIGGAR